MSDRLPRFLGLGVQKGGTTSLQRLLEQHPNVFLPRTKELHYFSLHYAKGEAWYRTHFDEAAAQQLCGEITPYYVFHPEAPKRISQLLPQAKLIVLLRDPVNRALSQYFHSKRLGLEPLELEKALKAEDSRLSGANEVLIHPGGRHQSHQEHSYLSRSRYEKQLPIWQNIYPKKQLLVLRSEDLFEQPELVWERVLKFLELPLIPLPAIVPANSGKGEAAKVVPKLRNALRKQLQPTYSWAANEHGLEWG